MLRAKFLQIFRTPDDRRSSEMLRNNDATRYTAMATEIAIAVTRANAPDIAAWSFPATSRPKRGNFDLGWRRVPSRSTVSLVVPRSRNPIEPVKDRVPNRRIGTAEIATATANGAMTISLGGELDIAVADQLSATLIDIISKAPTIVVCDLGRVTFIDSTGLRVLLRMREAARHSSRKLLIGRTSEPVRRVLSITDLTKILDFVGPIPGHGICPICESRVEEGAQRCAECGSAI
jgi:anti-sigma B factor antagonist